MKVDCTNARHLPESHPLKATHVRCAAKKELVSVAKVCGAAEPCKLREAFPPPLVEITIDPRLRAPRPPAIATPHVTPPPARPRPPTPPPAPIVPVPFERWGLFARTLYKRRRPGEKGIGTTLARIIDGKGGKLYKKLYEKITGRVCPCGERQDRLDLEFPYP